MATPEPEEPVTLEQVMQAVDELPLEERNQLFERMKLERLRKDIQIGIDQADRGEVVDAEVVFAELRQRAGERIGKIRNPEETVTIKTLLELTAKLSSEHKLILIEEIKLQWLRYELGKAEDELRRGECLPGEQVIAELRERLAALRKKDTPSSKQ